MRTSGDRLLLSTGCSLGHVTLVQLLNQTSSNLNTSTLDSLLTCVVQQAVS